MGCPEPGQKTAVRCHQSRPPRPPAQDGWADCCVPGGQEMTQHFQACPLAGALLLAQGQSLSGPQGSRD